MTDKPWGVAAADVRSHIVQIRTPSGSGTGFLLHRGEEVCAIATAYHVVSDAYYWGQPIRVISGENEVLLNPDDRAILVEEGHDSAAILFHYKNLPLPPKALDLAPSGKNLKVGYEVGWFGFPAVAPPSTLCFFSGRVSAWLLSDKSYLIDGVAINGVSGGPVISNANDALHIIGLVSAYIPNRSTGHALPGLAHAVSVVSLHGWVGSMRSVEEARRQQDANPAPPALAPEPGVNFPDDDSKARPS